MRKYTQIVEEESAIWTARSLIAEPVNCGFRKGEEAMVQEDFENKKAVAT